MKYNTFYRIINLLNGKFYYGVHRTNNLNDNYLGSGKRIKYAIKKYGKENFVKEILFLFDTYKEALEYENLIVNESLVINPNCYNIRIGGKGGFEKGLWKGVVRSKEYKDKMSAVIKNWHKCVGHSEETKKKISVGGKGRQSGMKDKHHTEESKRKIKLKRATQIITQEHKDNIRKSLTGKKRGPISETRKKLISERTILAMKREDVKVKLHNKKIKQVK